MADTIWRLPNPSQEFNESPRILISGGSVILRWEYEQDNGSYAWSSADFVGVEDVQFTSHSSCSAEQVEAYDRLVKVDPSDRLATLRGSSSRVLQHFRIYFDEVGCLDVIAEEFHPPKADP